MDLFLHIIQHLLLHSVLPIDMVIALINTNRTVRDMILHSRKYATMHMDDSMLGILPIAIRYALPITHIELRQHTIDWNTYSLHKRLRHIEIWNDRHICDKDIEGCVDMKVLHLPKNKCITNRAITNMPLLEHIDLSMNRNITDTSLREKNMVYVKFLFNNKITDAAFSKCKKLHSVNLGYSTQRKLSNDFRYHKDNRFYITPLRRRAGASRLVDEEVAAVTSTSVG